MSRQRLLSPFAAWAATQPGYKRTYAAALLGSLFTGGGEGSGAVTIGLGLDADLASHGPGVLTYLNGAWQRAGLTKVDQAVMMLNRTAFERAFAEATEKVAAIRFDVTRFNPFHPNPEITSWEFQRVVSNPALLEKTTFVQSGQRVVWSGSAFVRP